MDLAFLDEPEHPILSLSPLLTAAEGAALRAYLHDEGGGPLVDHDRCTLIIGDAADLPLPEKSVDSIVTDPPAGIGFMAKKWDGPRGGRAQWIAWLAEQLAPAYRALKPGGHGLIWSLPRTQHWTMCALEDLGFEIRDVIFHAYGSGFPKSLNVSKAIDAHLGRERLKVGERAGTGTREMCGDAEGKGFGAVVDVTLPGSLDAALADGLGTALKPAVEPWILVRKPLEGTVAQNYLKWGTGALAIGACRVGSESRVNPPAGNKPDAGGSLMMAVHGMPEDAQPTTTTGRWPAHLVLSHTDECEAIGEEQTVIPGQSCPGGDLCKCGGNLTLGATKHPPRTRLDTTTTIWRCSPDCPARIIDEQSKSKTDKAGASRFFYCPKPAKSETEIGLDHLPIRTGGEATDREDDSDGLNSPRAGAGRGGGRRNIHPTKKSVALMDYLIRLVTPWGGVVLDPFAGSGTTGVAALAGGWRCVLVEQGGEGGEYVPIIAGRVAHALGISPPRWP